MWEQNYKKMSQKRLIKLTESQEAELRKGYLYGKNPVFRKHCHALLLSNQGKSVQAIMDILGVSRRNTVYDWMNRWEAEGVQGLQIKPGRGRKPKLRVEDDGLVQKIKEKLEQDAIKLSLMKSEIEDFMGVKMHDETLRRFLKNLTVVGAASVRACASSETKKTMKKKFVGWQD